MWNFEEINEHHLTDNFRCKRNSQQVYLRRWALVNHQNNISKTTVVIDSSNSNGTVIAFYTLNAAQVAFESLSDAEKSQLPAYPIPAIRICQLAVDKSYMRKGLGTAMIFQVFEQVLKILPIIGIYLVILDVEKDNREAVSFYTNLGFELLSNNNNDSHDTYYFKVDDIVEFFNNK